MARQFLVASLFLASQAACQASGPGMLPAAPLGAIHTPTLHAAAGYSNRDIAAFRAEGPPGLAHILAAYDALPENDTRRRAMRDAIDQVAQQRDAVTARLYWHTDLGAALAAAKATGRPVLSLRLLGALSDELSCANSRFFRAILYPNAAVRKKLAEEYVLHWSTERPAPILTIDFRDGRKVTRTVTGNSIHYVLDDRGRVLDAMPGLVGPQAFVAWLSEARALASERPSAERIAAHHDAKLQSTEARFRDEVARAGLAPMPFFVSSAAASFAARGAKSPPSAGEAAPIAMTKAVVESPVVRQIAPAPPPPIESVPWAKLAPAYASASHIDAAGRAFLRAKNPQDWSDPSHPRPLDDARFAELVDRFETTVAADTAKNELALHARVHAWLAAEPELAFTELNRRVYAELFLTPASDPWLGLVPPGVFSGIADDGISSH